MADLTKDFEAEEDLAAAFEAEPDAPVVTEAAPAPAEPEALAPSSASGAALRGFGQGASLGFLDELAGLGAVALKYGLPAVEQLPQLVDPTLTPEEMAYRLYGAKSSAEVPYRRVRDVARGEAREAQAARPVAFGASQLAGAVTTPGPKSSGATRLGRLGRVAATGAAYGGAAGLGASEDDLLTDEDTASSVRDVLTGAGAGAVLAPAMALGGEKLARFLKTRSQENALKAMGVRAGISNQLAQRGYASADEARQLGQQALDLELIRPGRTAADVAERAGFAKDVQGARIEQALADADATGVPFDVDEAAWAAAMRAAGPEGLSPTASREATRAQRLVGDILRLPQAQEPTFSAANRLKSDMYRGINYGADQPPLKTELERKVASGLRSSIEEQLERTAGADVADELRAANRAYGALADIEPLARDEATRQLGRAPWYSPGVLGAAATAGAGGALAGGELGAAAGALPIAARILGPRIPSTLAVGQRALSPLAPKAARAFTAPAIQAPELDDDERASIDAFLRGY